jgi:hypothetical protein
MCVCVWGGGCVESPYVVRQNYLGTACVCVCVCVCVCCVCVCVFGGGGGGGRSSAVWAQLHGVRA